MSKFYVSFDRLAGPSSRYFNLSMPFGTFEEAEAHIATIVAEASEMKDKMRIMNDAIIITDKDLQPFYDVIVVGSVAGGFQSA